MVGTSCGDKKKKAPSGRIVVKKIQLKNRKKRATPKNRVAKKSSASIPRPASTTLAPTASFGLPTFQFQAKSLEPNGNHEDPVEDEDDLPSDTLMAIHSLIQSDQGLHVPTTNNGSVQVVLESQIYSIFDENHASTVNAELLTLIETNKVKRMCCHDRSTMAFILTEDFVKGVWDSHNNHESKQKGGEEIVAWFLAQFCHWTNHSISESSLEDRWSQEQSKEDAATTNLEPREVVLYLLNAQFLIRDQSSSHEQSYLLWLPNWGIVLKTWNEARKQLLTLLAQRKEMSKANVLQKNRHSHISTIFLVNELLSKEIIRVVERPFGSFIQLVKDV